MSETFAHLAAHEVMSPVVPRLWQSDCLEQALKFFIRFNLTEAAVVDNSRRLVGMVSQRDLMSATLQNGWQEEPILNLVQGKATCFTEQTPVLEIYGHFCRTNAQSVVIVKEGRPFGIIYRTTDQTVLIVAVADSRRKPEYWAGRIE